jgi:hypothetical protein
MEAKKFNNINGFTNASISNERTYGINYLHKLLGYCVKDELNNTIKIYEFKSSGNFETCEQHAIAKA